jgi:hypothetical protein
VNLEEMEGAWPNTWPAKTSVRRGADLMSNAPDAAKAFALPHISSYRIVERR